MVDRLVRCEARAVRRDLEKDAIWFAEVDRVEVLAVYHGRYLQAERRDPIPPLALLIYVSAPERDVMHRADRIHPKASLGLLHDVDFSTR